MHTTKSTLLLLGIFISGTYILRAQQGNVAAGGNATGSGGSVSYSIGQIDYIATAGSGGNTNEGLQQPFEFFTMGINDPAIQLGLSVYPNPSTQYILLNVDYPDFTNLSYSLYDMSGKQLASQYVIEKSTQISMEQYTAATYLLKISRAQTDLTTFTIIKK
jgi:hypothetical protein